MITTSAIAPPRICYELRFTGLFDRGRGYAFPCDAMGDVDIDKLSERGRTNYLFARAVVGTLLSAPFVARGALMAPLADAPSGTPAPESTT
jgi:hypothetical protein